MADYRQVKVPVALMVLVDRAVEEGAFRSPSAFVNDAVRRRLEAVGLLPTHASDPVAPEHRRVSKDRARGR